MKIIVILCFVLLALFVPALLRAAGMRTILKDFEADLFVGDDQAKERIGKAEWEEHPDGTDFSAAVWTGESAFSGPFTVYLNDVQIGETTFSGKAHRLKRDSRNGDTVPAVQEGDAIRLVDAKGVVVSGRFVSD